MRNSIGRKIGLALGLAGLAGGAYALDALKYPDVKTFFGWENKPYIVWNDGRVTSEDEKTVFIKSQNGKWLAPNGKEMPAGFGLEEKKAVDFANSKKGLRPINYFQHQQGGLNTVTVLSDGTNALGPFAYNIELSSGKLFHDGDGDGLKRNKEPYMSDKFTGEAILGIKNALDRDSALRTELETLNNRTWVIANEYALVNIATKRQAIERAILTEDQRAGLRAQVAIYTANQSKKTADSAMVTSALAIKKAKDLGTITTETQAQVNTIKEDIIELGDQVTEFQKQSYGTQNNVARIGAQLKGLEEDVIDNRAEIIETVTALNPVLKKSKLPELNIPEPLLPEVNASDYSVPSTVLPFGGSGLEDTLTGRQSNSTVSINPSIERKPYSAISGQSTSSASPTGAQTSGKSLDKKITEAPSTPATEKVDEAKPYSALSASSPKKPRTDQLILAATLAEPGSESTETQANADSAEAKPYSLPPAGKQDIRDENKMVRDYIRQHPTPRLPVASTDVPAVPSTPSMEEDGKKGLTLITDASITASNYAFKGADGELGLRYNSGDLGIGANVGAGVGEQRVTQSYEGEASATTGRKARGTIILRELARLKAGLELRLGNFIVEGGAIYTLTSEDTTEQILGRNGNVLSENKYSLPGNRIDYFGGIGLELGKADKLKFRILAGGESGKETKAYVKMGLGFPLSN